MKTYFLKTLSSRNTFPKDITTVEKDIMERHVSYWTEKANLGKALLFGPVLDPKGTYGIGIIQLSNENELKMFIENDPAVSSGLLKTEYFEMNAILSKFWKL